MVFKNCYLTIIVKFSSGLPHMDLPVLANQQIRQLCVDTGCHEKNLPRATENKDRLWERSKRIYAVSMPWWQQEKCAAVNALRSPFGLRKGTMVDLRPLRLLVLTRLPPGGRAAFGTPCMALDLASSLSRELAYVLDPSLGQWNHLAHQAHIALSELMSNTDQQGSSLSSFLTSPSPLSPL